MTTTIIVYAAMIALFLGVFFYVKNYDDVKS